MQHVLASIGFFFVSLTLLTGCSVFGLQDSDTNYDDRILHLSQKIKVQSESIQMLKDENLILRDLTGLKAPADGGTSVTDSALYAKIIKAYRKGDSKNLNLSKKVLLKEYPDSLYSDNAVFLSGHLHLKKGHYGEALKLFDQVIKEFKKGNKRAAALLSKGVTYKKLNYMDRAREYFNDVILAYPGSPESQQAKLELDRL